MFLWAGGVVLPFTEPSSRRMVIYMFMPRGIPILEAQLGRGCRGIFINSGVFARVAHVHLGRSSQAMNQ